MTDQPHEIQLHRQCNELNAAAMTALTLGMEESAFRYFREADAIYWSIHQPPEPGDDPVRRIEYSTYRSIEAEDREEFDVALTHYEQIIQVASDLDEHELAMAAMVSRSRVLNQIGRHTAARVSYDEQARLASQIGNLAEEGAAWFGSARMRYQLGEPMTDVGADLARGVVCFEELGDPELIRLAQHELGELMNDDVE